MLILRELKESDEVAFLNGFKDWDEKEFSLYAYDWRHGTSFKDHLTHIRNKKVGIGLPEGWVPSTSLYGFVDNIIVGNLDVRHSLNKNLLRRGGHIGYAVAPRFRRQGYATEMIKQALPYLRSLGVEKALITCADHNIASWKAIEHCNGRLENKVWDEDNNEMFRRYWVPT